MIERTSLDLRFQDWRIRHPATEARLLASIAQRGIDQPLTGIDTPEGPCLLDGFARYRCAAKLGIELVPYLTCGADLPQGIGQLLGAARQRPLSILEQARFVVELLNTYHYAPQDVARLLSRSKSWVSTRRNLWTEMSPTVQAILFRGDLSVYSYMVTLRPFMRMNGVDRDTLTGFMQAIAGQNLSVREIELLAHGYFRGPAPLRQAVDQGRWKWTLDQLQAVPRDGENCNSVEQQVLRELEGMVRGMQRLEMLVTSSRLVTRNFRAQAHLLLAALLGRRDSFFQQMEEFYDRCGRTSGHLSSPSGGRVAARNQSATACQPGVGAEDHQAARKTRAASAIGQEADR